MGFVLHDELCIAETQDFSEPVARVWRARLLSLPVSHLGAREAAQLAPQQARKSRLCAQLHCIAVPAGDWSERLFPLANGQYSTYITYHHPVCIGTFYFFIIEGVTVLPSQVAQLHCHCLSTALGFLGLCLARRARASAARPRGPWAWRTSGPCALRGPLPCAASFIAASAAAAVNRTF